MIHTTAHLKNNWVTVLISFVSILVISVVALAAFFLGYLSQHTYFFSKAAGISIPEITSQVRLGLNQEPTNHDGIKTFLLLGTDAVANRNQEFVLTDTMMLVSLNIQSGAVRTLSLPRDLWLDEYQTKINSLYYYGQARNPERPEVFVQEIISELSQVPIQHTLIISMNSLSELIDIVGGVTVEVTEGFTDDRFPRSDVDLASSNPNELYETVVFTKGTERMSSDRAMAYIRSRMSGDNQGTDNARGARQQQVIQALFIELTQPSKMLDSQRIAKLYNWYAQQYQDVLPISEIVATIKALFPVRNSISFKPTTLSIFPDDPSGVIEHPNPKLYQNLWVYRIRDLKNFQTEVRTSLGFNSGIPTENME
jgi:LCP family protein required for cell wall assembly